MTEAFAWRYPSGDYLCKRKNKAWRRKWFSWSEVSEWEYFRGMDFQDVWTHAGTASAIFNLQGAQDEIYKPELLQMWKIRIIQEKVEGEVTTWPK